MYDLKILFYIFLHSLCVFFLLIYQGFGDFFVKYLANCTKMLYYIIRVIYKYLKRKGVKYGTEFI